MKPAVFAVIGWRKSGKTTLLEGLIRHWSARGLRVATAKHTHHDVELDVPGKDSFRHRKAGAAAVALIGPRRAAFFHEGADDGRWDLDAIIARLLPADIVLLEGFKQVAVPALEVYLSSAQAPPLAAHDPRIRAIATDDPPRLGTAFPGLAVFSRNDIPAIARFLESCA
ncbi:MAG: molybdopterin-guanine dinucleotide biosynthesis protein B [Verrucomicrobia bacterium]|nr:MAG: molybdopterin-guanine dinucleotide biosynthesis protein B [Verrucomicrobiota bacterium]